MSSRNQVSAAIIDARSNVRFLVVVATFLFTWLFLAFFSSNLFAQGGGNDGQVVLPTDPTTNGNNGAANNGNAGGGANQTTNVGGGEFNPQDLIDRLQIPTEDIAIESQRLQPFVGRSIERYQDQELVHPRSQVAPGSAGGGAGGGGGRIGGGRNQGNNQTTTSFQVARQSLRTRVRPDFRVPFRDSAQVVSTRFQNRITRLPSTRMLAGVNVRMEGRTAILSGSVGTATERKRIERMARLEPGVSRIQNQIQVTGQ